MDQIIKYDLTKPFFLKFFRNKVRLRQRRIIYAIGFQPCRNADSAFRKREKFMSNVLVKTNSSNEYKQTIQAGSHSFLADAPKAVGGSETAPDPHELLLGSLGACTSITMQMYAKRKGWDLKEVTVELSEEKVEDAEHPGQTIAKIQRNIKVSGNLAADQVDSLKAIADKCPIHKLLSGPKQISTSIDLN